MPNGHPTGILFSITPVLQRYRACGCHVTRQQLCGFLYCGGCSWSGPLTQGEPYVLNSPISRAHGCHVSRQQLRGFPFCSGCLWSGGTLRALHPASRSPSACGQLSSPSRSPSSCGPPTRWCWLSSGGAPRRWHTYSCQVCVKVEF